MIFVAGCSTPTPPPVAATKPATVAATRVPARPLPPAQGDTVAPPPRPPRPPRPLQLSAGPWVECGPAEATVAVVVTVQVAGIFGQRVGVHYLRPAAPTVLRLVQLTNHTPVTIEQKEIPQACSSTFQLTNDDVYWTGTYYSVHSTLKQAPVDPTHAVMMDIRIRWRKSEDEENSFERKVNLVGVSHATLADGLVTAIVDIVPPESVARHRRRAPRPDGQATAALVERLRTCVPGITPIPGEAAFTPLLPARFEHNTVGLSGNNLYLYPDYSYVYTARADASPEVIEDEGRWAFLEGVLCLEPVSANAAATRPPADRYYLPVNLVDEKNPHAQLMLLGTNRGAGSLIERSADPSWPPPGISFALKSHAFSLVPPSADQPAPPTKEALHAATAALQACWGGPLERIPHTARNRSQRDGALVLSGEATVAFADAIFASDYIEISPDCSLVTLRKPVVIDWNGRSITASDAVIRLSTNLVQFESNDIRAR